MNIVENTFRIVFHEFYSEKFIVGHILYVLEILF